MPSTITTIAFDADDTLWENETFFRLTQDRFASLLAPYMQPDPLHIKLLEAERRNIGHYGYGVKGFMLSMIETAIEVSDGKVPASVIQDILTLGQDMLKHPMQLLRDVSETIPLLAKSYRLVLITKGDLLHQEQKIAASGLADYFEAIHIVSEKTPQTYQDIFGANISCTTMVGNSMKSDFVPAITAGAYAIHVPAKYEWDLEKADRPSDSARFYQIID